MAAVVGKCICVKNVFCKIIKFPKAGDYYQQHAHVFDHPTLVCSGSVRVFIDGTPSDAVAGDTILVRAGAIHKLIALEDSSMVSCIHIARRDENGEPVPDITDDSIILDGTPEMDEIGRGLLQNPQ